MEIERNKNLEHKESLEIIFQVSLGLCSLHQMKVIHSDLKFENVFVNNNVVKIGDLGFSKRILGEFSGVESNDGGGTTEAFYAPEFFIKNRKKTSKVDVWAIGCMLYRLLFGKKPFTGKNWQNNLVNSEYKIPSGYENIDPKIIDLLCNCFTSIADKRISIEEFLTKLSSYPTIDQISLKSKQSHQEIHKNIGSDFCISEFSTKIGSNISMNSKMSISAKKTLTNKSKYSPEQQAWIDDTFYIYTGSRDRH